MRIGCLQFAPQVGDVDNNLNRADAVLSKANPKDLDLLVLPELAFSGYNFRSLQHITPYLEPTAAGITSLWARTTALKYDCVVTVGYPEKVDVAPKWPSSPEYYNSAITVNAEGETIANYRKSFLYYTDETWALEGPDGFFDGVIPGLGNVTMGICMDLNPYKFEAPWSAWEFSYHCLHKEANLVIVSMAWLTREDARSYSRSPKEPDMETLSYWLGRIEPLIRAETEGEIICVFANRTGSEEEAVYAGTSAVLGIHMGEVKVYGILGRGERALLVVDTNKPPQAKLISEPNSTASDAPPPELEPSAGMPVPDSRTNSSTSNRSALSVDTKATSRATPDSWDNIFSPMSLNEAVTPLSPPDFATPEEFYAKARKADGEYLREDLISSLSQKSAPSVHAFTPIKPTFDSIPAHIKHKSDNSQQQFSPIESPVDRPFSRVASPIDLSTPLFHRPPPSLGSMMGLSSSRQPSPPERASSRSSHRSHQTSSAEPSPPLPRSSSRSSHKSDHVSSAEPSPPLPRSSSRTSQRSHQVSSAEPSPPLVGPTSSVPQMTDIASVEQSKPCSRSSSRNDLKSTTTLTGQALPIHTRSSSRSRQRIVQSPSTDALPPLDTTMHRTSHKSGHSVSSDALSPLRRSASRTSQKSAHPVPVPAEPSPPLDRSASRASQKSVQIGTGEFSPIDRSASRVSQKSIYFVDGEPTSPLRKQTSRSNLKSCLVKYQSVNSFEPVSPKAMSPTSPMSNYKASTRQQFTPALPDSPTFNRPASPKSRNASRTRKLEQHSPDLFSQPLPRETQHAIDSLGMRTPLLPQTAINPPPGFQAAFTNNFFGPRTLHVLPRPRSTYW